LEPEGACLVKQGSFLHPTQGIKIGSTKLIRNTTPQLKLLLSTAGVCWAKGAD